MPTSPWINYVLLTRCRNLGYPYEWEYRIWWVTQFNPVVNPILGRYPGRYYFGLSAPWQDLAQLQTAADNDAICSYFG